MFHTLSALLAPAAVERLTLVINHVLASEAVATERMRRHAGRSIELLLVGWPALLPAPPALAFAVTPAGLLEWCGAERQAVADLSVRVAAANPALLLTQALAGKLPAVEIDGDAQLATDVNWLLQNLRWDVEADLAQVVGPLAARTLAQLGSALAGAMRAGLQVAGSLGDRLRPRSP
ncbi:MAG: hypothetical protein Q8N44_05630 [Rubrivivax sp.]|nr:hypothetical protein [Rubrivivax sp.]